MRRYGKRRGPTVQDPENELEFKNYQLLWKFLSERGKIMPRRQTGLSAKQQRMLTAAVKRAREIALLPYSRED
ncbi:MAG: 30S ribosomal protein S18 [Armatimonadetes bacterium]|nr:30S ribosomal protein S18 [Armatimonadota bacterium]